MSDQPVNPQPAEPQPAPAEPAAPVNPQPATAMDPEVAAELAALRQLRSELEADRAAVAADRQQAAAALATAQRQVTSRVRRPPVGERANLPGEYDADGEFVFHAGKVVYDDAAEGTGKADGPFGDFVHADASVACAACDAEKAAAAA